MNLPKSIPEEDIELWIKEMWLTGYEVHVSWQESNHMVRIMTLNCSDSIAELRPDRDLLIWEADAITCSYKYDPEKKAWIRAVTRG